MGDAHHDAGAVSINYRVRNKREKVNYIGRGGRGGGGREGGMEGARERERLE